MSAQYRLNIDQNVDFASKINQNVEFQFVVFWGGVVAKNGLPIITYSIDMK